MAFVKPKAAEVPARKAAPPVVEEKKAAEARKPAPVAEEKKVEEKKVEEKKVEEKRFEEKKVAEKKPAGIVAASAAAPSGVHRIVMRVETDEAWLEVVDGNGRQLVSSLNRAGAERVVQGRGPFTFVIGNASHVRIEHNGREFDLKPHTRVEVARFTIP